MAYYVPLGPRGILMRLGSLVLAVAGGLVYWRASSSRPADPISILEYSVSDPIANQASDARGNAVKGAGISARRRLARQ